MYYQIFLEPKWPFFVGHDLWTPKNWIWHPVIQIKTVDSVDMEVPCILMFPTLFQCVSIVSLKHFKNELVYQVVSFMVYLAMHPFFLVGPPGFPPLFHGETSTLQEVVSVHPHWLIMTHVYSKSIRYTLIPFFMYRPNYLHIIRMYAKVSIWAMGAA